MRPMPRTEPRFCLPADPGCTYIAHRLQARARGFAAGDAARRHGVVMIHFTCRHCRKSVRVDDRFGGKLGRCPHCKQTVTIPAPDPLAALAAANEPKGLDDTDAFVPPPPGVVRKQHAPPVPEELTLPEDSDADLADTVILPAGTFVERKDGPQQARLPHPEPRLQRHRPALNAVRTILVLVAVLVVLTLAVLAAALAGLL